MSPEYLIVHAYTRVHEKFERQWLRFYNMVRAGLFYTLLKELGDSDLSPTFNFASVAFLGGTREIGSALTRMCMRHRSIETKLRQFSR